MRAVCAFIGPCDGSYCKDQECATKGQYMTCSECGTSQAIVYYRTAPLGEANKDWTCSDCTPPEKRPSRPSAEVIGILTGKANAAVAPVITRA